jgi:hypothetical protein
MNFLSGARITAAASLLMLTIFFFSCQKEGHNDPDQSPPISDEDASVYADESSRADASFDDLDEIGQVAAEEDDYAAAEASGGRYMPSWVALRRLIGNCAVVSVSPIDGSFPKTITIDFNNGCASADLKIRTGKIVIHLTAPRRTPGSVATITLVNYSLNKLKLEGTKVISNVSTDSSLKYNIQVTGAKVIFANGRGYSLESTKQKVQIGGQATPLVIDNVFQVTGQANITFTNGVTVDVEIVDPLIKKVICPWRSDGTLKIRINDNFTSKLDYGFPNNGDCDNKALLTWNGGTSQRVIVLP